MVWSEQFGVRTHSRIYRNTSTISQIRVYLKTFKQVLNILVYGKILPKNQIYTKERRFIHLFCHSEMRTRGGSRNLQPELVPGCQILKALNTKVPQTPSLLSMCFLKQHRREGQRWKAQLLFRAFYLWISIFSKVLECSSPSIQAF